MDSLESLDFSSFIIFSVTLGPSSSAFISFLSYRWLLNVATSLVNGPLEISITPVLTAQHTARYNVCKISTGLSCLFVVCAHLWEENYKKAIFFLCLWIYEGILYTCILSLHIHVFLHIPYNQTQATFLVFSIAVGPKCSYNFVPPMNSSNQTFNEIHKRQVLITNLQYSKDFNLILNRFNLIRFSVSLSMLLLNSSRIHFKMMNTVTLRWSIMTMTLRWPLLCEEIWKSNIAKEDTITITLFHSNKIYM